MVAFLFLSIFWLLGSRCIISSLRLGTNVCSNVRVCLCNNDNDLYCNQCSYIMHSARRLTLFTFHFHCQLTAPNVSSSSSIAAYFTFCVPTPQRLTFHKAFNILLETNWNDSKILNNVAHYITTSRWKSLFSKFPIKLQYPYKLHWKSLWMNFIRSKPFACS